MTKKRPKSNSKCSQCQDECIKKYKGNIIICKNYGRNNIQKVFKILLQKYIKTKRYKEYKALCSVMRLLPKSSVLAVLEAEEQQVNPNIISILKHEFNVLPLK